MVAPWFNSTDGMRAQPFLSALITSCMFKTEIVADVLAMARNSVACMRLGRRSRQESKVFMEVWSMLYERLCMMFFSKGLKSPFPKGARDCPSGRNERAGEITTDENGGLDAVTHGEEDP
jgi:hypothetical protein